MYRALRPDERPRYPLPNDGTSDIASYWRRNLDEIVIGSMDGRACVGAFCCTTAAEEDRGSGAQRPQGPLDPRRDLRAVSDKTYEYQGILVDTFVC